MEIIIGKTSGFCYGVKRAVDGALDEINNDNNIYCLGELVHNKEVISELEEKGIKFIDNIDDVKENSRVIVRAHGIEKNIYEIAKSKGIKLVDYTCPKVIHIHDIVQKYCDDGYYIFLVGEKDHPEVIGTRSFCGENYCLIEDIQDVDNAMKQLEISKIQNLLLIVKTTYSVKKFEEITKKVENLIPKSINLIIKNTICYATEVRQKETEELSKNVDKMIIVGGKNSSNTKKLYDIAIKNCKNTIHIETVKELENENFDNIEKVGIMAGASTPMKIIDEIKDFLI